MSDPTANAPVSFEGMANTQPPSQPPPQPAAPTPTEVELSQYAQSLLEGVPDDHKSVLEQYVPKWDAGIERRVAMLDQQYGPVAALVAEGWTPEELRAAVQLVDLAGQDPQKAQEILSNTFGWEQQQPGQQQQPQQQAEVLQLPPELAKQLGDINKFMEQSALQQQQMVEAQTQQQQDQALNDFMQLLEQEKGPFNEDFVLAKMEQGWDAAEAVDAWNAEVEKAMQARGGSGQPSLAPPPVLSGGAAVSAPVPIHQMSDQDRRAAVMRFVQEANKAS